MNATFFEATSDATLQKVHQARRKVLTHTVAAPQIDLFASNASHSNVKAAHTTAKRFDLFSGMGHGDVDEFTGQWGWILYDVKDTQKANLTAHGTIIHLYSCDCGQQLGPHLVTGGARAFIGYVSPVSVPSLQSVVDEFVKVAAAIDRSILSGDSAKTTKVKADAEFAVVDARLQTGGSPATPRDLARFRLNHASMVGPWSGSKYGSF